MTEVTAYELAMAWEAHGLHVDDCPACGKKGLCREGGLSYMNAATLNDRAIQEHQDYVAEALQLQGDMSAGNQEAK